MELTADIINDMLEFEKNAELEMACFGITNYKLEWDRGKRRYGFCNTRKKIISISYLIFSKNISRAWETFKHELAHAYACEKYNYFLGHGYYWKLSCMEIGILPKRCHDGKVDVSEHANYKAICSNCGKIYLGFRKRYRRTACSDCCNNFNNGNFSDKYEIKFEKVK